MTLFSITEKIIIRDVAWEAQEPYRCGQHPSDSSSLLRISGHVAHIYSWSSLERLSDDDGILLTESILPTLQIRFSYPCFDGAAILTRFSHPNNTRLKSRFFFFPSSSFTADGNSASPIRGCQTLCNEISYVIGTYGNNVVFLHNDGWVCTADQNGFNSDGFKRHFAPPADWLKRNGELIIRVSKRGDIVWARGDEVAVIQRSLYSPINIKKD